MRPRRGTRSRRPTEIPAGTLRRRRRRGPRGRASLGSVDRLGRVPGRVHPRGVLPRRGRARRRGDRLPVPQLRLRRAHRRRAQPPGARPAADLPGAGGGRRGPGAASRRRRPPRPRPCDGARDAASPRSPASDVAGRTGRSRASRSTTSISPTSTSGSAACRTTGSRSCATTPRCTGRQERDGRGFWAFTRYDDVLADDQGLADVQLRGRRDVAAGPDAGGGRGAEVDDRHRPAGAHPPAGARQQGLHAARRQHLRGADPGDRPRHPRAGVRARTRSTGSSRSPRRSRCGSSPRSWACPSRTGG